LSEGGKQTKKGKGDKWDTPETDGAKGIEKVQEPKGCKAAGKREKGGTTLRKTVGNFGGGMTTGQKLEWGTSKENGGLFSSGGPRDGKKSNQKKSPKKKKKTKKKPKNNKKKEKLFTIQQKE